MVKIHDSQRDSEMHFAIEPAPREQQIEFKHVCSKRGYSATEDWWSHIQQGLIYHMKELVADYRTPLAEADRLVRGRTD